MDNGSAHRGAKGDARLRDRWPALVPVLTPRHARWPNQIEIYFSIVQRKVLTGAAGRLTMNMRHRHSEMVYLVQQRFHLSH